MKRFSLFAAVLVLVLAACKPGAVVPPGFSLSVSGSPTIQAGTSDSAAVTLTREGGFADPVTLSVEGLPAGVTAAFSDNPAAGASSQLSLNVAGSVAPGAYAATVRGQAGSLDETAAMNFSVAAPPVTVNSVAIQGMTGTEVRQGYGLITLEVTGDELANIALAKLGSLNGTVMTNNDVAATIDFVIPHGADLGPQTLSLSADAGTVDHPAAVDLTPITSGPGGDDATGMGTSSSPYRSLATAASMAADGDTIFLQDGTYTAANGEVWPTIITADVALRGASQAGTLLDGQLAGVPGIGFSGDSSVSDLSFTGFTYAFGSLIGGDLDVERIHTYLNTLAGFLGNTTGQVSMTDSFFDQNQYGVLMMSSSTLDVSGTVFENNAQFGLASSASAQVTADGVTVTDTPIGIYTIGNSTLELRNSTVSGNTAYGLWTRNSSVVTVVDSDFEQNLYGVFTLENSTLLHTGGSSSDNIRDGYFFGGASNASLDGVQIVDNDDDKMGGTCFSGIAAFTTGSLTVRGTTIDDNCFGVYVGVEPAVFDMGTVGDPGNNSFSGNVAWQLYDNRPALAAPTGTVISAIGTSFHGILPSGGVKVGVDQQVVGPNNLWRIHTANNRIEFQP